MCDSTPTPTLGITVNGTPVPFHREQVEPFSVLLVLDVEPLVGGEDVEVLGQSEPEVWARFPYRLWSRTVTRGRLRWRLGR